MSKSTTINADITIIGGGLSGLAMACITAQGGIKTVCVDKENPEHVLKADFDGRTTAISAGSRTVLEQAGIWKDLEPLGCPIEDIHISDGGSGKLLEFLSNDVEAEAFGWIFENRAIRQALIEKATNLPHLTYLAPSSIDKFETDDNETKAFLNDGTVISSSLIVGADGRRSFVREKSNIQTRGWSYNQQAIVCTVTHDNPHNNIAVEDFRSEGPFAVLPMMDDEKGNHRSSVVWSEHGKKNSAMDWNEDTFNAALTARFPEQYGNVKLQTKRFSYPLGLVHAHDYIAQRTALIADAAHGIHPIAGQGLNLGYRDVNTLSNMLINAKRNNQDLGSKELLSEYQKARKMDNMAMAAATDSLNALFSNPITPVRVIRKMGLRAVQRFEPAKRFFMKQAMGKTD